MFARVQMLLDVNKELACFAIIHPEGDEMLNFRAKYENVPHLHEVCGKMGHVYTMEHEPSASCFGKWLIANAS